MFVVYFVKIYCWFSLFSLYSFVFLSYVKLPKKIWITLINQTFILKEWMLIRSFVGIIVDFVSFRASLIMFFFVEKQENWLQVIYQTKKLSCVTMKANVIDEQYCLQIPLKLIVDLRLLLCFLLWKTIKSKFKLD